MGRTLIFISIILLSILIIACAKEPAKIVSLPEPMPVENVPVEEKVVEAVDVLTNEKDMAPSESWQVGSKALKVLSIKRDIGVKVDVDGKQGLIVRTKDFEVVNGLKVEVLRIDFADLDKPKATIKAEEFKLGENEYLLDLSALTINNQVIKLKEVGEDYMYIEVGSNSAQKVFLNKEKSFDGYRFRLLKTFYLDSGRQPYAWVQIVSLL